MVGSVRDTIDPKYLIFSFTGVGVLSVKAGGIAGMGVGGILFGEIEVKPVQCSFRLHVT